MMARKHWIDNLRWVTVLLVLFYHVFYFYNNKGVFGGIGGFGEYPECKQYQDVVMYILYPWFMPLLFLLAGISARYALTKQSAKKWFGSRTRKLLVPGTIGLLVFQWMVGYFNTVVAERQGVFDGVPAIVKYFIMAFSGTGPLWFIQVLWLLCLFLLLVRVIDRKDKIWNWCGKANLVVIILLGVLFWVGEQTLIKNPRPATMDGLLNLYKPLFYLVPLCSFVHYPRMPFGSVLLSVFSSFRSPNFSLEPSFVPYPGIDAGFSFLSNKKPLRLSRVAVADIKIL